ncbi:flavodoxin family protein [Thermodesulfobacteriota bacterium]
MRVLGIYGSPRKRGNSDLLLDRALEGARSAGAETRNIYARDLAISGCIECGGCDTTGRCVVEDDMRTVYPQLDEAGVVIVSAPVFFYNFPAQLKALIDRAQALWARGLLVKRREQLRTYENGAGYLIGVGATRGKNLFEGCHLTVRYFFDALDMKYKDSLLLWEIEKKGAVLEHPDALERAFALGRQSVDQGLRSGGL